MVGRKQGQVGNLSLCEHLSYSFVPSKRLPEPPRYLRDSDSALLGELLLSLLTRVWVTQVGVEILIQNLRGLFAEVTAFPSIEERGGGEEGVGVLARPSCCFTSEGTSVMEQSVVLCNTVAPRLGEEWEGAGCWGGGWGPWAPPGIQEAGT